jgi:dihydroorotate dehydrogenase
MTLIVSVTNQMINMADLLFKLARPALNALDPERAHGLTIAALKLGLARTPRQEPDDPILATKLWDLAFPNPVGLAAGFDKDAEVCDAALALGFGFVEAGTVTPQPQPGNPGKRLYRLAEDEAVINRFGFNSRGIAAFAENLARRRRGGARGIVGANVGKNRDTRDAAADYVSGVEAVARLADYLVINISSPNTPGLRALQSRGEIEALLARVMEARPRACWPAAPSPRLPSGRSRPSSTGYGEGRGEGPLPQAQTRGEAPLTLARFARSTSPRTRGEVKNNRLRIGAAQHGVLLAALPALSL